MIQVLVKQVGDVGFTDRTADIQWQTLNIRQALTKEVDTCHFVVEKTPSDAYTPKEQDEVVVKQDGVKVFAGFAMRVEQTMDQAATLSYAVDCRDYTHLLDYKLVNKTYNDMTEGAIIADIMTNFAGPGITTTNVISVSTVDSITFNNILPSEALQKLADAYNKDWYIDYDKDLHYFAVNQNPAPWPVTDTNAKIIYETLKITKDATQIKNSVIVEGGNELSSSTHMAHYLGDGVTSQFTLPYQYSNATLYINNVATPFGIDGIDSFTSYVALYNFNTRALRFDPVSPPIVGTDIDFGGNYYFGIATRLREAGSVIKYGEREFKIRDLAIIDRQTAKDRAKAELAVFSDVSYEGEFESYEAGLRAGQQININSTLRGINHDFLITELQGSMYGPGNAALANPSQITWKANIVTKRKFDLMDLLARIVQDQNLRDVNAVILQADIVTRTIGVSRTILGRNGITYLWLTGPYYPTPDYITDLHRVMFTEVGSLTTP